MPSLQESCALSTALQSFFYCGRAFQLRAAFYCSFFPLAGSSIPKARPVASGTIPGLLSSLGSEWDALMLETFTLRRTLEQTREELSQALYQHDAACRVIARLMKEKDQLRASLTSAQAALASRPAGGAAADAGAGDAAGAGVSAGADAGAASEAALSAVKDRSKELSKLRRKRAAPADTAASADVSSLSLRHTYTPHSAATPGITALATASSAGIGGSPDLLGRGHMVLTGGADRSVLLYDTAAGAVAARMEHATSRGAVAAVAFHPHRDVLYSAGGDGAVRAWANVSIPPPSGLAVGGSYRAAATLRPHARDVIALAAHPHGDLVAAVAKDGAWSLSDAAAGRVLAVVAGDGSPDSAAAGASYSCGGLHPDGLLLCAGGADGDVRVFDLREMKVVAELGAGVDGGAPRKPVTALAFSENGYTMATGSAGGVVRIWDLRKVASARAVLHSRPRATAEEAAAAVAAGVAGAGAAAVSALSFDFSGHFLASGAANGSLVAWDVRADFAPLLTAGDAEGAITGLGWAHGGRSLYSVSMDRGLRVYAAAGAAGGAGAANAMNE